MLLFLDIDGVMVPTKSWKSPDLLIDGFPDFSHGSVKVLQRLISENTTIILTTSHKSRFTLEGWKTIFRKRGIEVHKIKTLENSAFGVSRKDEILNWFNLNSVSEDFLIIDDDKSLNDLPAFLKDHFVLTSTMVGLTVEHLEEIWKKLNDSPIASDFI